MSFPFGFIFNDLQSSKMLAHGPGQLLDCRAVSPSPRAMEALNKSEFHQSRRCLALLTQIGISDNARLPAAF